MNKLLWQRVAPLLAEEDRAVLATCGAHGPMASAVTLRVQGERILLYLPDASEHLFNLQSRPEVVLLSKRWELHGKGEIEVERDISFTPPWQVAVLIRPTCLHILSDQGTYNIETIDLVE